MFKFDPRKPKILDDPKRLSFENPNVILSEAGVKPGDVAADIGCGTGFFTFPLANIVGETGKIFALDTSVTMIKQLIRKARSLRQVEPLHSRENRFPLEDESLDFVLLANVIHELENWKLFLKEARRILKSGGTICVVDWKKEKMEMGPPLQIRFTKKRIEEMLRKSGFSQIRSLSPLPFHNGLIAFKSFSHSPDRTL
jgi:ubiquinone/menaquinone biosynthesis C-methylase UbiE